jgi:hypothetical protein
MATQQTQQTQGGGINPTTLIIGVLGLGIVAFGAWMLFRPKPAAIVDEPQSSGGFNVQDAITTGKAAAGLFGEWRKSREESRPEREARRKERQERRAQRRAARNS